MSKTDRDLDRVQTKVREQRRGQAARDWRKDPLSKYESELYDRLTGKDARDTMQKVQRFEDWLLTEVAPTEPYDIAGVRDAVSRDVEHWRDNDLLPDSELSIPVIERHLQDLKALYRRLNEVNAFAGNPVREPLNELRDKYEEKLEDPDRPYIPMSRLRSFLNWLETAFARLAWLLAFKLAVRKGEAINTDLRCLHIDHPIFWEIVDEHNVQLDPRVRDRPDTLLIYGQFNKGTEVPSDETAGWEGTGEVREAGNKRKQPDGSVLPIDSELKTAFIEWLLVREPTLDAAVSPLFAIGTTPGRINNTTFNDRLWHRDSHVDSIQRFSAEHELSECPTCGEKVVSENLVNAEKTGRRYRCRNCTATHWRSIHWERGLETPQKVTYHQGRHTFSSAHTPANSDLHDDAIPKAVRTEGIRGDSNQQGDTEDQVYIEGQYRDFEQDVRQPYLDGIYKFDLYDDPIPAVGEGWDR